MSLTRFEDAEGLTYVGSGQFVLTEERLRDAYLLTYSAGGTAERSLLASADLGTTVGNIGIEGISFDPTSGNYFTVKESSLQEVNRASISFGAPGSAMGIPTPTSRFRGEQLPCRSARRCTPDLDDARECPDRSVLQAAAPPSRIPAGMRAPQRQ
jgi:hypothetical protein